MGIGKEETFIVYVFGIIDVSIIKMLSILKAWVYFTWNLAAVHKLITLASILLYQQNSSEEL